MKFGLISEEERTLVFNNISAITTPYYKLPVLQSSVYLWFAPRRAYFEIEKLKNFRAEESRAKIIFFHVSDMLNEQLL